MVQLRKQFEEERAAALDREQRLVNKVSRLERSFQYIAARWVMYIPRMTRSCRLSIWTPKRNLNYRPETKKSNRKDRQNIVRKTGKQNTKLKRWSIQNKTKRKCGNRFTAKKWGDSVSKQFSPFRSIRINHLEAWKQQRSGRNNNCT